MAIYIILLCFLFLLFLVYRKKVENRTIVFFVTIILWLIPGLKDTSVGTDSYGYYTAFIEVSSSDSRMFFGIQKGWYYLNSFFNSNFNFLVFQLVCYAIIVGGFSIYIYQNSKSTFLSFFLFVALYFYGSSFNVMRQYIALAIVFSCIQFIPYKKKLFIIIVFIASTIHFTSIVCLALLLIGKFNINRKRVVGSLIVGSFVVGYFFTQFIQLDFYYNLLSFDRGLSVYADIIGSERNLFRGVAYSLFFLLGYFWTKDKQSFWLKSYFVFVVIFNLLGSMGQGNRLFLFLQLNMLIAIPEIYRSINRSIKRNMYLLCVLVYSITYFIFGLKSGIHEIIPYKMISALSF